MTAAETTLAEFPAQMAAVASPIEALRLEEMDRSRVFFRVVLAITVGGTIVALLSAGDPIAKAVVIAGSIASAIGAAWILAFVIRPARYDQRRILLPGLPVLLGGITGIYYWGAASPVSGMLVFGIYFFSLGADSLITTVNYIVIAVSHGLLGLGIITGLVADHGLVRMTSLRLQDRLAIIVIVECLYLCAFITARLSQRATLRAVIELEHAVRDVAQREALLAEARAELDRVREIGGAGKFSDQLIGSYKLGPLIGRGAMGDVYEASHVSIQREAAIKLLRPGAHDDPMHLQRFQREAEATARIDCPHVVRVFDVGTTAGAIPFIVMERLRGHDLAHELRSKRRLDLADTKTVVDHVAVGLEATHAQGIVHRDLKPNNVFCSDGPSGRVWKLLDFGVSKLGDSGVLTVGNVIGTPAYMAPEQARASSVDHRADLYSLSAIIYRAVTGFPAFGGKDIAPLLYDVVYRMPPRPSSLAPLSADIDRVLAIGLAKDPKKRFQTATELATWFAAAAENGLPTAQRDRADELIALAPWDAMLPK
jgi:serine/threonine-protein kinase